MKNIFLTLIALSIVSVSMAGSLKTEKVEISKRSALSEQVFPYSSTKVVTIEEVFSKSDYTLVRIPSSEVTNFPGASITGNSYNYFVYKNGTFHLTVNENNKKDVYKFFSK